MRDDQLQRLREDYPDLVSAETTMDARMPEAWLTPIRAMLVAIRVIKFGRRVGVSGGDIKIRAITARLNGDGLGYGRRTPAAHVLDVQYYARAAEKTKRYIKFEISIARFRCGESHAEALRQQHLLDIVGCAQAYVRATIRAGKPLAASDVVVSSAFASEEVRNLMPSWAIMTVDEWLHGGSLGDLTPAEKSRFIGIVDG